MSALGQKRTYAVENGMSALRPIATAKATSRKRSCPLYPQKRTCAVFIRLFKNRLTRNLNEPTASAHQLAIISGTRQGRSPAWFNVCGSDTWYEMP